MLRRVLATSLVVLSLGCSGRQVVVQSSPSPAAAVSLAVTNRLSQAINVYVVTGGTDAFLKQVAANSSELVPVPNLPSGTSVQLKARTTDGTRTFTRDNVVLQGTVSWEVR